MAMKSGPGNCDNSDTDRSVSIKAMLFLCTAHLRHFRQTQHPVENVLSRRVFDFSDTDRVGYIESARSRPAQRFQMGATAKGFADLVNICADIKTLAAQNTKVDFG